MIYNVQPGGTDAHFTSNGRTNKRQKTSRAGWNEVLSRLTETKMGDLWEPSGGGKKKVITTLTAGWKPYL